MSVSRLRLFGRALGALALTAALVAACAAPATPAPTATPAATPTAEPLTFTDGLGRAVTLAGPAQRIITLAPSNTELLFAVGAGGQMAGRDELSDYPPEAQDVASIGSTYGALNTELIVSLKPDLVLLAEVNTPENVKTLEDLGLTVFYLSNPVDFDGLYANVLTIGRLTGRTAEAEALAASLRARVEAVLAKTSAVTDHPKVFYEIDATDPTKPFTVGAGTFMDTLLTLAGGENVGAALESPYPQISSEELVKQDPALILLGDAAYGVTPESVAARPGWEALTAVKTNQIAAFDDNLVSRPGPRLVNGLELLAKLLHPELFQ